MALVNLTFVESLLFGQMTLKFSQAPSLKWGCKLGGHSTHL